MPPPLGFSKAQFTRARKSDLRPSLDRTPQGELGISPGDYSSGRPGFYGSSKTIGRQTECQNISFDILMLHPWDFQKLSLPESENRIYCPIQPAAHQEGDEETRHENLKDIGQELAHHWVQPSAWGEHKSPALLFFPPRRQDLGAAITRKSASDFRVVVDSGACATRRAPGGTCYSERVHRGQGWRGLARNGPRARSARGLHENDPCS